MINKGETYMNFRKSILFVAIAGMIITLALAASGQSQDRRIGKKVMEGTWKVTVTPGQSPLPLPPTIESLVTYVPGGGLIESDNLGSPDFIVSPGLGAWESTDARQFNITFTKYLVSFQGPSQGSVRINETITRDASDSQYTGVGVIEVLDPTGTLTLVIPITTRAVRVSPEAP